MNVMENLKYSTGLCLVMVLGVAAACSKEHPIKEEVVSIYGPNFDTPSNREPYFIKIYRCVTSDCNADNCWAVPKKNARREITIVVPDINNKAKFYKYIVFNHTACECSRSNAYYRTKTQHGSESKITETDFKNLVSKNPVNIRGCNQAYCSQPQPRYLINPYKFKAAPRNRYILYRQCLPGCKVETEKAIDAGKFKLPSGKKSTPPPPKKYMDHQSCSPYIPKQTTAQKQVKTISKHSLNTPDATMSPNGLSIHIASTKLVLAAIVLTLVLLSLLVIDCNLFHRKKGLIYSVLCCTRRPTEMECAHCADRRYTTTQV